MRRVESRCPSRPSVRRPLRRARRGPSPRRSQPAAPSASTPPSRPSVNVLRRGRVPDPNGIGARVRRNRRSGAPEFVQRIRSSLRFFLTHRSRNWLGTARNHRGAIPLMENRSQIRPAPLTPTKRCFSPRSGATTDHAARTLVLRNQRSGRSGTSGRVTSESVPGSGRNTQPHRAAVLTGVAGAARPTAGTYGPAEARGRAPEVVQDPFGRLLHDR